MSTQAVTNHRGAKRAEQRVKETQLLMVDELVLASLNDRKQMTRRLVEWRPYHDGEQVNFLASSMSIGHYCTGAPRSGWVLYSRGGACWQQRTKPEHCPYGNEGDRLWVREAWANAAHAGYSPVYFYRADGPEASVRWRPSIHMPRAACRLVLEITSIRIERLQQITEEDARAEGASKWAGANDRRLNAWCYWSRRLDPQAKVASHRRCVRGAVGLPLRRRFLEPQSMGVGDRVPAPGRAGNGGGRVKGVQLRDGSIEAGLHCLSMVSKPGQTFTQGEIAQACGCSRTLIYLTEQRALKKIRERLRRELKVSYAEMAEGGML